MRLIAALVHLFTALGAVAALFAVLALQDDRWEAAFVWLGIAFIIDGIDGTFARAVRVDERLPRFSGERLDLIVDYVTYVFVPALALLAGGYLSGATGYMLAAGILLSSLFHFADQESKAEDYSFIGFPAVWNVVAFYVFVMQPQKDLAALVILALIILTFVPLKWVHPFRVMKLRGPTIAACAIWALAAISATWTGFENVSWPVKALLIGVALYCAVLTLWSSYFRRGTSLFRVD
jgi:phosphatidylcholine synthase